MSEGDGVNDEDGNDIDVDDGDDDDGLSWLGWRTQDRDVSNRHLCLWRS